MLSLEELKIKFLVRFPGFKDIFERVKLEIDDSLATACTDGYTLYFSSEYMSKLTEEQQLFVFAHELLHVALEHIFRSEGKNHKNWNIATDAVINAYIKKCGIKSPDNLVEIVDALNYSAEELYNKLEKEDEEKKKEKKDPVDAKDSGKKGSGTEEIETNSSSGNNEDKEKKDSSGSGDNKEENPGFDDHSRWQEGIERHKKEQQEKGKTEEEKIDEKEKFNENDKLKDKIDKDFVKDKNIGSTETGKGYGGGTRTNPKIEPKTPIIDWRRKLKESIRIDYDYITDILEEEDGILKNPFDSIPKPKTEIVIDSSASISDDLIKNFLSECSYIIKETDTEVGFFGSDFGGFTKVRTVDEINELPIYRGGGTNFNAAVNAFTGRAENKIIFTDGYASMPDKYCDAIWVVVGDYVPKINPPGGKVIYITGEDYKALKEKNKSKNK